MCHSAALDHVRGTSHTWGTPSAGRRPQRRSAKSVTRACAKLMTFSWYFSLPRVDECHNHIRLRVDYTRIKEPCHLEAKRLGSFAMDDKVWCSGSYRLILAANALQRPIVSCSGFQSRLRGSVAIAVEVKRQWVEARQHQIGLRSRVPYVG